MNTAPLLIELLTEELPPKALQSLAQAFAQGLQRTLAEFELLDATCAPPTVFAAPRRLGVHFDRVLGQGPAREFVQKLVPVPVGLDAQGAPTPALRKKLEALGLPLDLDRIQPEEDGTAQPGKAARPPVLCYRGVRPGRALAEALQAALDATIQRLPIPKVMSYQLADGLTTVQFVRPAHGLIALHGTQVVPVGVLGLNAGRQTRGHRFHAPGVLELAHADDYATRLRDEGHVMAAFGARRASIVEQLEAAGRRLGLQVVMPDTLVDEVCALVEWPVVYESGFDAEFLDVPQSCLILTMQLNQKYFALQDGAGHLVNRFLLVSNIATDDPSAIVSGNARVVRARLADAKFFFDQDRLQRLESRLEGAAAVVYHRNLGSQAQRNERLVKLAGAIAQALDLAPADCALVRRAALLAKADLGTLMVGEFPELQGEMGAAYAQAQGEPEAVSRAIEEHYRPRFAGDAVPSDAIGSCVALADKLETLAGLFGTGERPSGDRDPFALRRNALGVLRILEDRALPIALPRLLALAFDAFDPATLPAPFSRCEAEVASFIFDRLRGVLLEQGYQTREVDAVVSLQPERIDRVRQRMAAVRTFMQLPDAANLAAANKRISNILRKAAESGIQPGAAFSAALADVPAETALAQALAQVQPRIDAAAAQGDDATVLLSLAPLREPVDRFFDDVMVMAPQADVRDNRLALLATLHRQMNRIADISLLASG